MKDEEINDLVNRYLQGNCTPEEINLVNSYFNQAAEKTASAGPVHDLETHQQRVWEKLGVKHKPAAYVPFMRYAAILTVIFGLSLGYYQYFYKETPKTYTKTANDIPPGGNKAVLTLANGQQINLNAQNGALTGNTLTGTQITNNTSNGIVTFQTSDTQSETNHPKNASIINKITTPTGGQYKLVLADGTRVFLNSESELTFPGRFSGKQREVRLKGQAYFEVAHDAKHPFIVTTQQQQLTVLGTHFDVNAYSDQSVKTTLAEGSVVLLQPSTGISQPLKPDQQAALLSTGFNVKRVITSDEIAWIDGMFIFKQTPLKEAMQQISRWYGVEVDYASLPNKVLDADLSRQLTLAEVLKGIEYSSQFKFTLQGRRLVFIK